MTAWDAELVVGFLRASGFLLKMGTSNCPTIPAPQLVLDEMLEGNRAQVAAKPWLQVGQTGKLLIMGKLVSLVGEMSVPTLWDRVPLCPQWVYCLQTGFECCRYLACVQD